MYLHDRTVECDFLWQNLYPFDGASHTGCDCLVVPGADYNLRQVFINLYMCFALLLFLIHFEMIRFLEKFIVIHCATLSV